jgi:hypothetical protein
MAKASDSKAKDAEPEIKPAVEEITPGVVEPEVAKALPLEPSSGAGVIVSPVESALVALMDEMRSLRNEVTTLRREQVIATALATAPPPAPPAPSIGEVRPEAPPAVAPDGPRWRVDLTDAPSWVVVAPDAANAFEAYKAATYLLSSPHRPSIKQTNEPAGRVPFGQ